MDLKSVKVLPLTLCDPMVCPGKNTVASCHALLQEIFTQRLNSGLLHCRWILHHLSQMVKKRKEPNGTEYKLLHSCRSHEVSLYLLTWKAAMIYDMVVFWLFFWPHPAACRILGSQTGIEPKPSAVKSGSLTHRTTREFPRTCSLTSFKTIGIVWSHLCKNICVYLKNKAYACQGK